MVIPLPVPVVERLTIMEKTSLLGYAAYMLFYAYDHQVIKWYQTAAFGSFLRILMIAITVVVTIVTWGTGTGPTLTMSAALMAALEAVAIAVAVSLALQLIMTFVKDTYLKMFLSVAVMVAAIWAGGGFDNFNAITAVQLADIPVKCADIYLKDQQMNFQDEVGAFNQQYESRTKALENALEGTKQTVSTGFLTDMMTSTGLEPYTQAQMSSPSDFFYLAIDSYRSFDVLYSLPDTSVHQFVTNHKRLTKGVGEE